MNIKKSLSFRSKFLIEKILTKDKLKNYGIANKHIKGLSLEMIDLIEILETIKNYNISSNILLDIGTHKGYFAKFANLLFKWDKIICFEPNLELYNTIINNNENNNLIIENIALSDQEGQTNFYLHQDNSMSSILDSERKLNKSEFPFDNPDLIKEIIVKTNTLDKYIEQNKLSGEKFIIKIDTQGNELNILKHGVNTLKSTELCIIEHMFFSHYKSNYTFYDLLNFMNENGFVCEGALTISKRPSKKISSVDFLFINKSLI